MKASGNPVEVRVLDDPKNQRRPARLGRTFTRLMHVPLVVAAAALAVSASSSGAPPKLENWQPMADPGLARALVPAVGVALEGMFKQDIARRVRYLRKEPGPGYLKGIVHDAADLSDHYVHLCFVPEDRWPGRPIFTVAVRANARFSLSGIPPADYYLFCLEAHDRDAVYGLGLPSDWPKSVRIGADEKPAEVEFHMSVTLAKLVRRDLRRPGLGHFINESNIGKAELGPHGRVLDADGRPVPWAAIQVRQHAPGAGGIAAADTVTNVRGYWGLAPLSYPYYVGAIGYFLLEEAPGYRWQYLRRNKVFDARHRIDFKFPPWPAEKLGGGTIIGKVVDERGRAMPAFKLALRPDKPWTRAAEDPEPWYHRWGIRAAFAGGSFVLPDVPPGDCVLTVNGHAVSGGGWNLAEKKITVRANETLELEIQAKAAEKKPGLPVVSYSAAGPAPPTLSAEDFAEVPKVGQAAPPLETNTLDGKILRLADYRGRFVLLTFWVSGADACENELPYLKAVYDAFGRDKRFAMLGLNLNKDAAVLPRRVRQLGLNWPQAHVGEGAKSPIAAAYGVNSVPTTMLIGPDGKLIARNLWGEAVIWAAARALKLSAEPALQRLDESDSSEGF